MGEKHMICLELDEEDIKQIDSVVEKYGLTREEVVRLAVKVFTICTFNGTCHFMASILAGALLQALEAYKKIQQQKKVQHQIIENSSDAWREDD